MKRIVRKTVVSGLSRLLIEFQNCTYLNKNDTNTKTSFGLHFGYQYQRRTPAKIPEPIASTTSPYITSLGTGTPNACKISTNAMNTSNVPTIYKKILTAGLGD